MADHIRRHPGLKDRGRFSHSFDMRRQAFERALGRRLQSRDAGADTLGSEPGDVLLHDQGGGNDDEAELGPPVGSPVVAHLARSGPNSVLTHVWLSCGSKRGRSSLRTRSAVRRRSMPGANLAFLRCALLSSVVRSAQFRVESRRVAGTAGLAAPGDRCGEDGARQTSDEDPTNRAIPRCRRHSAKLSGPSRTRRERPRRARARC